MQPELDIFNKLTDIKVVFDVGPRTDMNYERGGVTVHYFEPNPEFAKSLHGIVNQFGLSDHEGIGQYFSDTQSFEQYFEKDSVEPIQVPIRTLDSYTRDIPVVDFLKIDAEGSDYKIMLGGNDTLNKIKYIQFEWWDGVKKFVDLLYDFDLYLMYDERLYNDVIKTVTGDLKYINLLTPLTPDVIDLIDKICIPRQAGGTIFGKRK